MGINHNYLLYFKRDRLWDALNGLAQICDTEGMTPTTIHFPDHDIILPLMSSWGISDQQPHNKPEYQFAISMFFDFDPAIGEYLLYRDGYQEDRSPPEENESEKIAIGFIYLTVYADLSSHFAFKDTPTDMVLFEFGTTGTKMSSLFYESSSIRRTFVNLLERYEGEIGIFDVENDYGQLFWFRGEEMDYTISDNYLLPEQIERELKRGY